jgi:RNA polymerase sigma-70 factor, ECF subfamily
MVDEIIFYLTIDFASRRRVVHVNMSRKGHPMDDVCSLIEAEVPRLRRYARALLRDKDRADDLVQDTIARALKKIHLFQRGTDLRAWLFTMLHNQYVNSIRRAVRHGQTFTVEKVHLPTPPAQLAGLELRDLERAIQRLPEEQRTMLLLIGLEGMSYEEVARVCGVPIGTVRSRVSRARQALRQMLEPREATAAAGNRRVESLAIRRTRVAPGEQNA